MNSYDIIRKNIEFDDPPRIGLRFNSLGVSDVKRIYVQPPARLVPADIQQVRMDRKINTRPGEVDEWGCKWESLDSGLGGDMGQVLDPPLKELQDVIDYPFPDPYDPHHFAGLDEALADTEGLFVQLNSPFCLFERLHFLRGFEASLSDLILQPELSAILLDKILDYQIGIAEMAGKLGKGRIHCFDTTDDWGTQTAMFISPRMWRKLFKPRYKKLIDVIHANGMYLRFHTDGKINPIFEDLIDLGVDILNMHQPLLLGFDDIREKLRGRICMEVSVDIQSTLPKDDKEAITAEVQQIIRNCCTPSGGLIGVEYRHGAAIGISKQALAWELEAYQKFGNL